MSDDMKIRLREWWARLGGPLRHKRSWLFFGLGMLAIVVTAVAYRVTRQPAPAPVVKKQVTKQVSRPKPAPKAVPQPQQPRGPRWGD